ncbi:hypothetical protein [Gordonia sp. i37]|uniref:hypothetical protein n=1 Tax=Gordonia sp. i37 TaxID=1961707 RepID=UPI001117C79F|nr:hypothetical protein [Gordonia sp. i37]
MTATEPTPAPTGGQGLNNLDQRPRRNPKPGKGGPRPIKNSPTEMAVNVCKDIQAIAEIATSGLIQPQEVHPEDKRRLMCETYAALNALRKFVHAIEDSQ